MFAVPVNVATGAVPSVDSTEDWLAVAGVVVRSLADAVVLVSTVTDAGRSPVTCETELELELLIDLGLDIAVFVCLLIDTDVVEVGKKVGVLSVIDNRHILVVPVTEAGIEIEIVASGI